LVFLGVGTTMAIVGALLIYLGLDPTIAVAVVTGIGAAAAQVTTELLRWRRDLYGHASIRARLAAMVDEHPGAEPAGGQNSQPGSDVA